MTEPKIKGRMMTVASVWLAPISLPSYLLSLTYWHSFFFLILLNPCLLTWRLCLLFFLPGILFCQFFAWLAFYHTSIFCLNVSSSEKIPQPSNGKGIHLSQHPVSLIVFITIHDKHANFLVYLLIFISWSRKFWKELHVS